MTKYVFNLHGPPLSVYPAPYWMNTALFCGFLPELWERINTENPPTSLSQIIATRPTQNVYLAKAGDIGEIQRLQLHHNR